MSDTYAAPEIEPTTADTPGKRANPNRDIRIQPVVHEGPGADDFGEPVKRPPAAAEKGTAKSGGVVPGGADDFGEPLKPIDYTKGADFTTRVEMERADNPREAKKLLSGKYGAENIGQDDKGEWWVKNPATGDRNAVFPDQAPGVLRRLADFSNEAMPEAAGSTPLEAMAYLADKLNSFAPRLTEKLVASAGPQQGAALGAALGAPAGPGGMAIGGGIGYALGKGLDDVVKGFQGFHDKSVAEELGVMFGPDAAINMMQPGMAGKTANVFKKKGLGVTAQSSRMGQEVMTDEVPAQPPVGSVATEASGLEMKRKLSKEVSGDPYRAQNVKWLESRILSFLTESGLPAHEARQLMDEMWSGASATEGKYAAQSLVDAAQRRHTSLEMAAHAAETEAKGATDAVEKLLKTWASTAPRDLGADVGATLLKARAAFGRSMSTMANNIHQMVGGAPVVPADEAIATAKKLMAVSPPDTLPSFVTDLAKLKPGERLTIEQAHNYRTFAREAERNMVRGGNMTPGTDYHYFSELEDSIDSAISAVAAQSEGDVGKALKAFDSRYREGIVTFKNAKARALLSDIQRGQVPEPWMVARDILEAGSMQDVMAVKKYLTPEQIENVSKAFTDNLIRSSSTEATEDAAHLVLRPNTLLRNIEKYQEVMKTFGISPKFISEFKEFANTMRARNSQLDPKFLREGPLREKIAQWKWAQGELDAFVKDHPLAAFRSGNAAAKDASLSFITAPGKQASIHEVMQAMTPVERLDVQLYTLQRLFNDTMETTSERVKSVKGSAIKDWLKRYTPQQQDDLFGYGMAKDLARLGDQVNYVFRDDALATGASQAAVGVQSKGFFNPLALHKRMMWYFTTFIAHQPRMLTWLADLSERDPTQFRLVSGALNRWLITASTQGPGPGSPPAEQQGQPPQ